MVSLLPDFAGRELSLVSLLPDFAGRELDNPVDQSEGPCEQQDEVPVPQHQEYLKHGSHKNHAIVHPKAAVPGSNLCHLCQNSHLVIDHVKAEDADGVLHLLTSSRSKSKNQVYQSSNTQTQNEN